MNSKTRRHDGRVDAKIFLDDKKQNIINNCLEFNEYWDDWQDYRDGFRLNKDRKMLRSKFISFAKYLNIDRWNKKIKKLINRRKCKKRKYFI
ncbi:MAG: hypothetical protein WC438_05010 [Candidatus Pacearchaeota archaeon]